LARVWSRPQGCIPKGELAYSATERRSEGEAALTNKLVKATTYEEITEEPQRSEQDMDAEIGTEIQRRSEGATMEFQSLSAADLGSTDSEPFPILPSSIVGLTCKLVKETTYKEISEGTQKYEGGMNRVIDTEIQRRFEGDAKEFQGHSGKALETTYYDINSETERRSEGNMMGIQSSSIEALGVTDSEPCPLPSSTEAAIPFKLVEETTYEEISEETQRSDGGHECGEGHGDPEAPRGRRQGDHLGDRAAWRHRRREGPAWRPALLHRRASARTRPWTTSRRPWTRRPAASSRWRVGHGARRGGSGAPERHRRREGQAWRPVLHRRA
jgi:hypothetical protein